MRALIPLALIVSLSAPQPVIAQEATGQELCLQWKERARDAFPIICALDQSPQVVQDTLEVGSQRQFLLGVWGGRDEHRIEALRVINRMCAEGKTVGIVFGPDRDTFLSTELANLDAEFEPYAHGAMASEGPSVIGLDRIETIATELATMLNRAYVSNYSE